MALTMVRRFEQAINTKVINTITKQGLVQLYINITDQQAFI